MPRATTTAVVHESERPEDVVRPIQAAQGTASFYSSSSTKPKPKPRNATKYTGVKAGDRDDLTKDKKGRGTVKRGGGAQAKLPAKAKAAAKGPGRGKKGKGVAILPPQAPPSPTPVRIQKVPQRLVIEKVDFTSTSTPTKKRVASPPATPTTVTRFNIAAADGLSDDDLAIGTSKPTTNNPHLTRGATSKFQIRVPSTPKRNHTTATSTLPTRLPTPPPTKSKKRAASPDADTAVPGTPSKVPRTPRTTKSRTAVHAPTPLATPSKSRVKLLPTLNATLDEEDSGDESDAGLVRLKYGMPKKTVEPVQVDDGTDEACFSAAELASEGPEDEDDETPALTLSFLPTPVATQKPPTEPYPVHLPRKIVYSLLPHLSRSTPLPIHIPSVSASIPALERKQRLLRETPCLPGMDEWELELRRVVERTVGEAEGNVVVVCGGRGVGKTAMVHRTLSLLSHPSLHGPQAFLTIKLSGLTQTTDRLLLRELARQLCLGGFGAAAGVLAQSEEAEDQAAAAMGDGGSFTSYSQTLKNLLAVLEPSEEVEEGREGEQQALQTEEGEAEQENAEKKKGKEVAKPLVIVLEGFDLIAEHPRQSFLYCLLDMVQGGKRRGGVAVIGVTSAVRDGPLGKRVKSRCQSRVLYVHAAGEETQERMDIAKALLTVPTDLPTTCTTLGEQGGSDDAEAQQERGCKEAWNVEVERFLGKKETKQWVEDWWVVKGSGIVGLLDGLNTLIAPLAIRAPTTFPHLLLSVRRPSTTATTRNLLSPLSILDLSVLVSAKHLSASENLPFNFEMCWDVYRKHVRRARGGKEVVSQVWDREGFNVAWHRLRRSELVLPFQGGKAPPTGGMFGPGGRFKMCKLVVWPAHIEHEVEKRTEAPRHLKAWCKSFAN